MQNNLDFKAFSRNLEEFGVYKYAAYRTALKVRKLQTSTKFHLIDLGLVVSIFNDKEISQKTLKDNLTRQESENVLKNLYGIAKRQFGFVENVSLLTEFVLNFLSSAFGCDSGQGFMMYQLKVILTLLCSAKLTEKYKYIFHQFSTRGFIKKEDLFLLLNCIANISVFLKENLAFGNHLVKAAVNNCLQFGGDKDKVNEANFLNWLSCDPQSLVWISTLYRLSVSERIEHDTKCEICKTSPIIGLRYKCLFCIKYNLCQQCFLRGLVSKSHAKKHPIKEHCKPATGWEEVKSSLTAVRNKMFMSQNFKLNYLAFENENYTVTESCQDAMEAFSQQDLSTSDTCVLNELKNIINKLEVENRQICAHVECLNSKPSTIPANRNFLKCGKIKKLQELQGIFQNHSYNVETHLCRLRELLLLLKSEVNNIPEEQMRNMSPKIEFPTIKIVDYCESTPIIEPASMQQNLRYFIRQQAEQDGIQNLSRAVSSATKDGLYSIADIEMTSINPQQSRHSDTPAMQMNSVFSSLNENVAKKLETDIYDEFQCESGYPSSKGSVESHPSSESLNSSNEISSRIGTKLPQAHTRSFNPNEKSNEYSSTQSIENELQQILEQLEQFFPKVTGLKNDTTLGKSRFLSALSEMEDALRKLSNSSTQEDCFCIVVNAELT